ncbi:MAG: retron St85 family RNA-directed DNA polymerase [Crocinitomicaceae bacterium]|nr:retron St85 family RNA-directed DNA polymerase [Crocinitomicaceae bacterium]
MKDSKTAKKYRLKSLGLPIIESADDFTRLLKISSSIIQQISKQTTKDRFYKEYRIPKKSKGFRQIAQPVRKLKALQIWILRNILDKLTTSDSSKGFEKGTNIKDNVRPHVGARVIMSLDLESFFPSISSNKVFGIFYSLGYNTEASWLFTNICTYKNKLPQGSPSSPKLSNLICWKLDFRIEGYTNKRDIVFSRYADDLTFSSKSIKKIIKAKNMVKHIIEDEGFVINEDKTRIMGPSRQKKVTGLIVSGHKVGIGRKKYREMRVKIINLFTHESDDFSHVMGWMSYINSVDKSVYKRLILYIEKLSIQFSNSIAVEEFKALIKNGNL